MSLPALARTWQFQVSQLIAAQLATANDCALLMFSLKQSLIGAGAWTDSTGAAVASAGNWVVRSANDGQGAGHFGNNDNIDRWLAAGNGATTGDLRWAAAGSNHSWIVLEQAGIPGAAGNFQLCIDLSNAGQTSATIVVSPSAGFAGGTATARPTAADEQVIINNTAWGGPATDNNSVLHVLKTNDGKSTRIVVVRSSSNATGAYTVLFWGFELPVAIAAWTNPSAAWALGSSAGFPTSNIDSVANMAAAFNTFSRTPGGTNFTSKWTEEGTQQHTLVTASYGDATGTQQNVGGVNNEAPLFSIGIWSATVNARGRNGRIVDIRQGLQNTSASLSTTDGRSYPTAAPTRQWMQFGDYAQPWNRSVPKMVA